MKINNRVQISFLINVILILYNGGSSRFSERTPRLSSVVGNEVAKITSVKSRPLSAGQTKRMYPFGNLVINVACLDLYTRL